MTFNTTSKPLGEQTQGAALPSSNDGRIDVSTSENGDLLLIGINRPGKLNGFTPEMMDQLAEAYGRFEQDPSLRVAVVYAEGDHFTAGLDLPRWHQRMKRGEVECTNLGESATPSSRADPFDLREPRRSKPIVFAVQGYCYTLGIELMLAADIVIAAENTRFAQLEVKRGIMATGGGTFRIAERAGSGNALWMLLTGDEIGARTAFDWGLVQQVVPTGEQKAAALRVAERIASVAPLAVQETILNARLAREHGPAAAIAAFGRVQSKLAQSEDAAEGVLAFQEKRPPRFVGR